MTGPADPAAPGGGRGLRVPDAGDGDARDASEGRPVIERIGLAAIALVLVLLFAFVAAVSWVGGEPFLAFMGALGAVVTGWLAVRTLVRG